MELAAGLSLVGLLLVIKQITALDRDLSCAVCRALVDEINFEIGKVDPKKKIQVGSFRVDSRGNQGTYEKSYARSEVHLLELFEGVCAKFQQYAESTNSAGKRSIARIETRQDGKTLALKNIKINPQVQKEIKFGCEHLVEEYEDDMIALFRRDNIEDMESAVCAELTAQCTGEDLSIPMPQTEVDENVIIPDNEDTKKEGAEKTGDKTEDTTTEPEDQVEKPQDTLADVDDELLEEYMKDNIDSIPADRVQDKKFEATEDKKIEL